MVIQRKIKVLVVDDSMLFREVLCRGISSDPNIEVVARAVDPYDARDKILQYNPHVMTCDVEMPRMNGIEFIRKLLPQYPLPVIVVSNVNEAVFDAMNAGAVDFVVKPNVQSTRSVEQFIGDLIAKIKIAFSAKVMPTTPTQVDSSIPAYKSIPEKKVIAIGASTGGTEAIYSVLNQMPSNIPGIVITQHMPPGFTKMFADRLNNQTKLFVKEAIKGDIIEPGKVLIAPGDMHMKVRRAGDRLMVECFKGEKVNGHCPSVDVLFDSVAKEAGGDSIGIILTGMGYDGARGLLGMRRKGSRTIGQDEKTSVVYGMPKVAYEIGAVEKQIAIENISKVILSMLR